MIDKNNDYTDIVTYYESERFIEELKYIDIKEYGNVEFLKQHKILTKLNIQAHINVNNKGEEYIMESFNTFDKINLLIYELLLAECWKKKIIPSIKNDLLNCTLKAYMVIFHESIISNIIEIIFFHRTSIDTAGEDWFELSDYCYRKLVIFQTMNFDVLKNNMDNTINLSKEEEFDFHIKKCEFTVCMSCISIIYYISNNINNLQENFLNFLVNEKDILMVLIPLIEKRSWFLEKDNKRYVWENNNWKELPKVEYGKVYISEANIWISIYNFLLNPITAKKYEITDFRRNQLLGLKKYLNELIIDQISILSGLLRTLEELTIMKPTAINNKNLFLIQNNPEILSKIYDNKNWTEIIDYQKTKIFNSKIQSIEIEILAQCADIYSSDLVTNIDKIPKCQICLKDADKRCSRCKKVWYCSRECQIKDYKKVHKLICKSEIKEVKTKIIKKEVKKEEIKNDKKNNINLEELD